MGSVMVDFLTVAFVFTSLTHVSPCGLYPTSSLLSSRGSASYNETGTYSLIVATALFPTRLFLLAGFCATSGLRDV
jgi:hypothetical protein